MRTALIRLALLMAILAAAIVTADASTRYDPRLRFRTISTPRFDIHYHQGEEDQAHRLAALAEEVAARLDTTLGPASGRVQVILVAQSDLANGWATPLPFNTIEIVAAAPSGASVIGNTTDWLRMVFTHEYTHIVHLSRSRGWIGGLRRVFGRNPLLFPNLYLPVWQVEGLATYEESALTGQGRVRDTSFRAILDVAAARDRFEPLDRVGGGLVDWPGGDAPYLYGAYFHAHLAAKYGETTLRQLTDETAKRIPFLGSSAFKQVFDRPLGTLWKEYEEASRASARPMSPLAVRRTHHGFDITGPRFAPDGRLYYSSVNPHGFPSLMSLDGSSSPVKVRNKFLGNAVAFAAPVIVFDQIEVANSVALQSDLYIADADGRRSRRLTRGLRAGSPDISADSRTIVCTIQESDRRALALIPLNADGGVGAPTVLVSEPGVHFAGPRWSPDGASIAAERGSREIVIIDPRGRRAVRSITAAPGSRVVEPSWTADGRFLLFASDQRGHGFEIHRLDIKTGAASVLEGTGPDARQPNVSPRGDRIAFVGYTADGYDIFDIPWEKSQWTPEEGVTLKDAAASSSSSSSPVPSPAAATRTYSPWATLLPRFWTPTLVSDSGELFVGAATGSADALGRHAYAVDSAWTSSRARPDWLAAYAYDRWRPTFFADVSDDTDPWRGGEFRTREANGGLLLPFRQVRRTQTLLAAVHSSTDEISCPDCAPAEITRRSVRGGWRLAAARGYGYSISLEDGWSATTGVEFTRAAWGSRGNGGAATVDVRGYAPFGPQHAVLAMRGAAATSWGDQAVRRVFSASGQDAQPGGFRFGSEAAGLLRGVASDQIIGRHAAVINMDYRLPLVRIDRGWGTVPAFARVVHGAVFADVAHAWSDRFNRADATVSLGAEISLDAVIGFRLPVTVTGGAAWVSHDRGFTTFGRIGRAF